MYIIMSKKKEDLQFVWYHFSVDGLAREEYIDSAGMKKSRSVEKQGACRFNKETKDLTLDWDRTDTYFLDGSRALFHILAELLKGKRLNHYAEEIHRISC
ncbi:MAG TPA: hypothetical protein VGT41_00180 [Candidatus Babeliales bacterium]|nr:hypothetical protein [Candidatus Babeliales bacterium]